jgi:hypothetical protein
LASLTVRVRPWKSAPFVPAIASSPPLDISTNPNPRLRPVSRSVMTWALVTVPNWPNTWASSSLVVWKAMLPTYSFLLMVLLPRA